MKKQDKNTYITKTLIKDEDLSELDFVLHDEFKFDYENGGNFITIQDKQGRADATEINIDTLMDVLAKCKHNGATHVEINDHCDHHGYEISAYRIRFSDKDEIDKHNTLLEKRKNKEDKIKSLQQEIEKIRRG